MLAITGIVTILGVLLAIVSKRLSPLVALVSIPAISTIILGQATQLPEYMVSGITAIAPVAVMFMFAILFFGIMNDRGVFTPFINLTLKLCGSDPRKLFVGVVLLTALVHLDGSGASTFLIVVPAMLPVFDRLQIDRRILAALVAMSAGVANMLPWGGPTIRAAAALETPVMEMYQPLLFVHLGGFLFVLAMALWLGSREQLRLKVLNTSPIDTNEQAIKLNSDVQSANEDASPAEEASKAADGAQVVEKTSTVSALWLINVLLMVTIIGSIVMSLLPPVVAFMAGALIALLINYPSVEKQKECIDDNAAPVFMMVSILFAAGCFTGILRSTGMLEAMAQGGGDVLPAALASQLPILTAVISMPLSLLFDPDSFYFGILPVLSEIASEAGTPAVSVAHGALLGQMTTGFPVSPLTPATFLLVGLARISLADHQRFALPLLFLTSLFMSFLAAVLGVLPI